MVNQQFWAQSTHESKRTKPFATPKQTLFPRSSKLTIVPPEPPLYYYHYHHLHHHYNITNTTTTTTTSTTPNYHYHFHHYRYEYHYTNVAPLPSPLSTWPTTSNNPIITISSTTITTTTTTSCHLILFACLFASLCFCFYLQCIISLSNERYNLLEKRSRCRGSFFASNNERFVVVAILSGFNC